MAANRRMAREGRSRFPRWLEAEGTSRPAMDLGRGDRLLRRNGPASWHRFIVPSTRSLKKDRNIHDGADPEARQQIVIAERRRRTPAASAADEDPRPRSSTALAPTVCPAFACGLPADTPRDCWCRAVRPPWCPQGRRKTVNSLLPDDALCQPRRRRHRSPARPFVDAASSMDLSNVVKHERPCHHDGQPYDGPLVFRDPR